MARKSNLTDDQRREILRLSVEKNMGSREIGRNLGIPESTIRRNLGVMPETIRQSAQQIVTAERVIRDLSVTAQMVAFDHLANLRAISANLSEAARIGTHNAVRLNALAADALNKATVDPENPDYKQIQAVAGLTKTANDAAQLGVQLISANKGAPPPEAPAVAGPDVTKLSTATLLELQAAHDAANT